MRFESNSRKYNVLANERQSEPISLWMADTRVTELIAREAVILCNQLFSLKCIESKESEHLFLVEINFQTVFRDPKSYKLLANWLKFFWNYI